MKVFSFLLYLVSLMTICSSNWLWQCEEGNCVRESTQIERGGYTSLKLCQLVCSNCLNIWPQPTGTIKASKDLININTKSILFYYNGPTETITFLTKITKHFENQLKQSEPFSCEENLFNLKITLSPESNETVSNVYTIESYSLALNSQSECNEINVVINAPTVFGVRHGMETLLQILIPHTDEGYKCLTTLSSIEITDQPKYPHRGLLIDTARNYLSVRTIKKQIDAMAMSKLNVLHWHLTDSQSFPFVSKRLPNMTLFGAYSPSKVYTPDDIRTLVHYAEYRGVRILIEIDGPSHAGMGWQWGPEAGLGNLAVCINSQPWRSYCIQPPCGQLNPVNPKLYSALEKLYLDIKDITPDRKMFHMGGDEVFIPCWNSTPEILKYLKGKPLTENTFLDLWALYQSNNLNAYDTAYGHKDTSIIVWTSHLTQPQIVQNYLSNDRYIIQTWVPESENDLITSLLNLGYRLIISTKDRWYLDHGFWGTTKYYNWHLVYENQLYNKKNKGILGGEVCMWGELVDDANIDSRVWPRAAAAAERLWSDPKSSAAQAANRFFAHRERLIEKGIHAEAVTPHWCTQNEGECDSYLYY